MKIIDKLALVLVIVGALNWGSVGLFGFDCVDICSMMRPPLPVVHQPGAEIGGIGGGTDAVVRWEDLSGHRMIVSQRGSLMRWAVDEALAGGVDMEIGVEVAHRTSILPLVLAGIGHAVLPSAWVPLARQAGLRTARLEPETSLHVSALSRTAELTPAARAFLVTAAEQGKVPAAAHG